MCTPLCLNFYLECFSGLILCWIQHEFVSFHCWAVFPYRARLQCIYLLVSCELLYMTSVVFTVMFVPVSGCYNAEHSVTHFCMDMFSGLSIFYLGMELMGHMVPVCLALRRYTKLFSKVAVLLHNHSQQCVRVLISPIPNTQCYLLNFSHATNEKSDLLLASICISLITNDVEHLYIGLLTIYIYSFVKHLVNHFALCLSSCCVTYELWRFFVFWIWVSI